jgi:small subunit ribosomal protein S7
VVEHRAFNLVVAGSKPAILIKKMINILMYCLQNSINNFKFTVSNCRRIRCFATKQGFNQKSQLKPRVTIAQGKKPFEQSNTKNNMIKKYSRIALNLPVTPLCSDQQINNKNFSTTDILSNNVRFRGAWKLSSSQIELYDKFMNLLMIDGKKIKAYNIFYDSLRCLEVKNIENPLHSFKQYGDPKSQNDILARTVLFEAVKNVEPSVEVRKVRKGGITYQVPALIPKKRQETLAIRWIIDAARNRKKNSKASFAECLAVELTEASKKLGKPRQKRDELHKLAELNRAYIRFRWW